ncbi:MAG: Uma2 family endonuclease [Lachnospiraceae bacterium]|nr:Uma2 family endonuclease [Lachnospiraceae bacterium]
MRKVKKEMGGIIIHLEDKEQIKKEKKVNRVEEPMAYAVEREKQQGEYTLEDYYTLPDDRRVELIDGVFYDMSAPSFVHQDLSGSIYFTIKQFIRESAGSCVPLYSPVDVNLDCDDKTMVQPDVVILCDRSKIRKWGVCGAPDFCMEILSESTRRKDCVKKLQKYSEAGVKEYWILDPFRKVMMTYCWKDDYAAHMYPLEGSLGMELYDGELQIDLGGLAELIVEYP